MPQNSDRSRVKALVRVMRHHCSSVLPQRSRRRLQMRPVGSHVHVTTHLTQGIERQKWQRTNQLMGGRVGEQTSCCVALAAGCALCIGIGWGSNKSQNIGRLAHTVDIIIGPVAASGAYGGIPSCGHFLLCRVVRRGGGCVPRLRLP